MSGLAHAFKAIYDMGKSADDEVYLAGIWRDDLSRGLLWNPHDSSGASRHSRYVAPTWSWASIKGQVHFPYEGLGTQQAPVFVSASLEWKADDRMGAIDAAKLTLFAKVRRLSEITATAEISSSPLKLRFEGSIIGTGAFDVISEGGKSSIWVMQCTYQKPWDYRGHPTLLLLHGHENMLNAYERVGAGRLDEDALGFSDECEPQEITLM